MLSRSVSILSRGTRCLLSGTQVACQGNLAITCRSTRQNILRLHGKAHRAICQGVNHSLASRSHLTHHHSVFSSSSPAHQHYTSAIQILSRSILSSTPRTCTAILSNARFSTSANDHQVVTDGKGAKSIVGWWHRHKRDLSSAPLPALVLGFSGLIPFAVPAVYSLITMSCGPNMAFAQVAYGATILSFLGGIRWGYALAPTETPSWLNLGYSVTPSLVAWMGLMMPIQPGLFCIISGLALAGVVDSRFGGYASWFRSLRLFLTTFAILSISVTFVFSILFPPPEPEHGYNFRKLIKIAQIIVQD